MRHNQHLVDELDVFDGHRLPPTDPGHSVDLRHDHRVLVPLQPIQVLEEDLNILLQCLRGPHHELSRADPCQQLTQSAVVGESDFVRGEVELGKGAGGITTDEGEERRCLEVVYELEVDLVGEEPFLVGVLDDLGKGHDAKVHRLTWLVCPAS